MGNGQVEDDEERPAYAPDGLSEVSQRVSVCPSGRLSTNALVSVALVRVRAMLLVGIDGFGDQGLVCFSLTTAAEVGVSRANLTTVGSDSGSREIATSYWPAAATFKTQRPSMES